jgi:hypothetical protein
MSGIWTRKHDGYLVGTITWAIAFFCLGAVLIVVASNYFGSGIVWCGEVLSPYPTVGCISLFLAALCLLLAVRLC